MVIGATSIANVGDFDKALADYSEMVRLAPKYPEVYTNRARFHRDRGDIDKALADCTEATRLGPTNSEAYAERAALYASKGESRQGGSGLRPSRIARIDELALLQASSRRAFPIEALRQGSGEHR